MNIANRVKTSTMILTILLAFSWISCGVNPLHQGVPLLTYIAPAIVQEPVQTPPVTKQDTVPIRKATPAQIEMTRRINKAFNSIDDISTATTNISEAQRQLVTVNKELVSITKDQVVLTMKQKKAIDSLTNIIRPLNHTLESYRASMKTQGMTLSEFIRKSNRDAEFFTGCLALIKYLLYFIVPFILGGLYVAVLYLRLYVKKTNLEKLIQNGVA